MEEPQIQSVEFEVNLPKPRPRNVIGRVLIGLGLLALVGVVAMVVISRTATPTVDPLAQVMPNTVAIYFSMTTHPEKQPNFQVIANAWKDSREANQVNSALELAVMQAGVNWEDDVQPWLGERVAVGLIDLGGTTPAADGQSLPAYRLPAVIAVLPTTDHAKSDAFLVMVRKQLESQAKRDGGAFTDEVYRGINLSYLDGDTAVVKVAYASFNDTIVLALGVDNLKRAVDASLDRSNLAASAAYQKTMSALPGDNVGAVYMDNARYAEMALVQYQQTLQTQPDTGQVFDNIYTSVYSHSNSTPDPNMQKEIEARKQQREAARLEQEQQLQKLREQLKTVQGGSGMVMTYEPTGIRISTADYTVPGSAAATTVSQIARGDGRILNSVPASALLLIQGGMSGDMWQNILSPEFLATQSLNPSWQNVTKLTGKDLPTLLAEFEQQAGVNLKTDLLGLFEGEMAFLILPKAAPALNDSADTLPFGRPSFSVPFELAAVIDSTDAVRVVSTFDKIFQAIETSSDGEAVWQGPGEQPYSMLLNIRGDVMLTYGIVDGRFVIGSTADTLKAIDNADQNPITTDADFKDASTYVSGGKPATMYIKFDAFLDWYFSLFSSMSSFGGKPADCGACNYMKPFKYLVTDSASNVGDVQLGSMFIKIEAVK